MKVTLSDIPGNTTISISDDTLRTNGEILIESTSDGGESWHSIKNLKDFEDLIDTLEEFKSRMKQHFDDDNNTSDNLF